MDVHIALPIPGLPLINFFCFISMAYKPLFVRPEFPLFALVQKPSVTSARVCFIYGGLSLFTNAKNTKLITFPPERDPPRSLHAIPVSHRAEALSISALPLGEDRWRCE